MPTENRGKTAGWAKGLAWLVLIVVLPLVVWFLLSLRNSDALPW
ncbi:hypothetical protein ACIBU0_18185 [Streptomyces sp. NPDC049627]